MKRVRLDRWASQIQPPRNPRLPRSRLLHDTRESSPFSFRTLTHPQCHLHRTITTQRRSVTTTTSTKPLEERSLSPDHEVRAGEEDDGEETGKSQPVPPRPRAARSPVSQPMVSRIQESTSVDDFESSSAPMDLRRMNSPVHTKATKSAKLAALHARLSLPSKLPLEVLARCLIDPSVDERAGYNNSPFAILGQDLLGYYTAEYLMCRYPRLPMSIVFAAQYAYNGSAALAALRAEWGVEVAAAPGSEVDPGLLQLKRLPPGSATTADFSVRSDIEHSPVRVGEGRRNNQPSFPKRIVFDDEFGDLHSRSLHRAGQSGKSAEDLAEDGIDLDDPKEALARTNEFDPPTEPTTVQDASATFVRALTGALHIFGGDATTKAFHQAHILSRHLDLQKLFHFTHPTRDLSRLCAREGLQPPVARLLSETGRLSRTPVFIVGVYSGDSKVGEGAGSSLNEARVRAAAAALRSWYLYSPPENQIVLPSDVEGEGAKKKKWRPQTIDVGEVIA